MAESDAERGFDLDGVDESQHGLERQEQQSEEHDHVNEILGKPRPGLSGDRGRLERAYVHQAEPDHTDRNVTAVGTGEGVKRGPEQAVREGHLLLEHEVIELVDLAAEENHAEENRGEE